MRRIQLSLILAVGLAGACSGDPPPWLTVAGDEVPSPAGVGSGEPFLSSSGDVVYMSWLERAGSRGHERTT